MKYYVVKTSNSLEHLLHVFAKMEEEAEDIVEEYFPGDDDSDDLGFASLLHNAQVVSALIDYFNEKRSARRKRKMDAAAACILESKKTKIELAPPGTTPPGIAVLPSVLDPEMPQLEGSESEEGSEKGSLAESAEAPGE